MREVFNTYMTVKIFAHCKRVLQRRLQRLRGICYGLVARDCQLRAS